MDADVFPSLRSKESTAGLGVVLSALRAIVFPAFNASANFAVSIATASLALHVRHQSAVKSTKTAYQLAAVLQVAPVKSLPKRYRFVTDLPVPSVRKM